MYKQIYLPNFGSFFSVKHFIGHTLGMVGMIGVKWKASALNRCWTNCVTLTFDLEFGFLSQNLKELYLRNMSTDNWHGMEGICWVRRILDPLCDLELWPWPWILWSNFEIDIFKECEGWLTWNKKDTSPNIQPLWPQTLTSPKTLTLDFHDQISK